MNRLEHYRWKHFISWLNKVTKCSPLSWDQVKISFPSMRERKLYCIQPNYKWGTETGISWMKVIKHIFAFKSEKLKNTGIRQARNDKGFPLLSISWSKSHKIALVSFIALLWKAQVSNWLKSLPSGRGAFCVKLSSLTAKELSLRVDISNSSSDNSQTVCCMLPKAVSISHSCWVFWENLSHKIRFKTYVRET